MSATPVQARPYTPLLSQQFPGGSEILDRNLLAIQRAIGEVIDNFNRTITFIGIGGTGGSGPGPFVPLTRKVNTDATLTGGGSLALDLTLGRAAISGDVVISAGSNSSTIQPNVVTYGKLQTESPATLLGNLTAGVANVQEVQLGVGMTIVAGALATTAILSLTGDGTAAGPGAAALTVISAAGSFSTNGKVPTSNASLTIGNVTQTARDHVRFFVASASLNNDTPDNASLDIITASPTIASAQTLGVFATLRVRGVTYAVSGVGTGTYNTAASLYVDGPLQMPPLGGGTGYGSTGTPGGQWGIYCATGGIFGDNITAGTQVSAAIVAVSGSAGAAFTANGNTGPGVSFFGVATATRQTGGAATAGATYTATEQGMLNRAYSALRTYGLLT